MSFRQECPKLPNLLVHAPLRHPLCLKHAPQSLLRHPSLSLLLLPRAGTGHRHCNHTTHPSHHAPLTPRAPHTTRPSHHMHPSHHAPLTPRAPPSRELHSALGRGQVPHRTSRLLCCAHCHPWARCGVHHQPSWRVRSKGCDVCSRKHTHTHRGLQT